MIMNNKSNNISKIQLDVEKEKTKQLELIRDIKKLELKLRLNNNYQRKQNKSFDMYKMISELNDESIKDDSNDESNDDSNDESNDESNDDSNDESNDDSNDESNDDSNDDNINDNIINDTISMCSEYSYETYEEVDLIPFKKVYCSN
jgi:hypothetical protein